MARDPHCKFCKIIAAELPAAVVYEDQFALGFLDVNPLAEGHLLLIPREHFARLGDMPPTKCSPLASVLPVLSRALIQVTGAEGINVLVNDGAVAGQVVSHAHFHLIPRRQGDGLGFRWMPGKYPEGRAAELAGKLQAVLSRHGD